MFQSHIWMLKFLYTIIISKTCGPSHSDNLHASFTDMGMCVSEDRNKKYRQQEKNLHTVGRINKELIALSWPERVWTGISLRMSQTWIWYHQNIVITFIFYILEIDEQKVLHPPKSQYTISKQVHTRQTELCPPVTKMSNVGWRAKQ